MPFGSLRYAEPNANRQCDRLRQVFNRSHNAVTRVFDESGEQAELEGFLRGGLPIVETEPGTIAWFAIRLGSTTFGIFDAFPDEEGRQAHLSGKVAAALMASASDLLSQPPVIEKVDVRAAELPS